MNARLSASFCIALGLHAGIGMWLAAALVIPEMPLASETAPQIEMELTAPEETPPATGEIPAEETPPPPPEPAPAEPPTPEPPAVVEEQVAPMPAETPLPEVPKITPPPTPRPKPKQMARATPPQPNAPRTAVGPARPAAPAGPSTGPQCVSKPAPTYPAALEERGIGGSVTIQLTIDTSGKVSTATLSQSSGQAALDRAALSGVRRWKFKPALHHGQPIVATTRVTVVFRPQ